MPTAFYFTCNFLSGLNELTSRKQKKENPDLAKRNSSVMKKKLFFINIIYDSSLIFLSEIKICFNLRYKL